MLLHNHIGKSFVIVNLPSTLWYLINGWSFLSELLGCHLGWHDSWMHGCIWNGEGNVCSAEFINNNPWTGWHAFFFYHLLCSLFRCCLQCFNYLHYLSDDGDVSFDDDFDKIGNSVSSSCDFLFYLSLIMLFKVGPFIPVSMPALQKASLGQEEWAC